MSRWLLPAALAVAVGIRIVFWLVTDRTWEDALITLAHVRNAAQGFGLTHHAGEPVTHGFTSAASVLVPLPGEVLWPGSGLSAMRVASLVAAGATIVLAHRIARYIGLSTWSTAFVLAYLALDQLHILFGMAGMETQLAVGVLLGGILAVVRERAALAGLLAGLAVLTRPDLVLWLGPTLAWAWMRGRHEGLRATAGAAFVVAPWLAFTTIYYGSPVPQTIVAKSLAYSTMPSSVADLGGWAGWLEQQVGISTLAMLRAFIPFFEDGTLVAAPVPAGLLSIVGLGMVVLIGLGIWSTRRVANWWPVLAYVALFIGFWLVFVPPVGYFSWYLPPFTAVAAILAGAGLERVAIPRPRLARLGAGALAVAFAIHLPWSTPLEARVQAEIDDGVRREVGLYLGEVVAPGEAVVAEAAGYIGYYSRATMFDYPGLTSRTALEIVRSLPRQERGIAGLAAALRAPWAVFRPGEWEMMAGIYPEAADCYEPDRTFGTERDPVVGLNGLWKWNQDWTFTVYRRHVCNG